MNAEHACAGQAWARRGPASQREETREAASSAWHGPAWVGLSHKGSASSKQRDLRGHKFSQGKVVGATGQGGAQLCAGKVGFNWRIGPRAMKEEVCGCLPAGSRWQLRKGSCGARPVRGEAPEGVRTCGILSGPKVGPTDGPETVASVSPEKGIWGESSPGKVEGHCHTCHCGGMAGSQAQAGFTWRRGGPGASVRWWEWRGYWPPGLQGPSPCRGRPCAAFPGTSGAGLLLLANPGSFAK